MATGNITRLEGVWPETHERAVRDSAGVNLETKLGNINSNISQLDQEVDGINKELAVFVEKTKNVFYPNDFSSYPGISMTDGVVSGTALSFHNSFGGTKYYPLYTEDFESETQYTFSCKTKTDAEASTAGNGLQLRFVYTDGSIEVKAHSPNSQTEWGTLKGTSTAGKTLKGVGLSYSAGEGKANTWYLTDIQLEKGTSDTTFVPCYSAVDIQARDIASGVRYSLDYSVFNVNTNWAGREITGLDIEEGESITMYLFPQDEGRNNYFIRFYNGTTELAMLRMTGYGKIEFTNTYGAVVDKIRVSIERVNVKVYTLDVFIVPDGLYNALVESYYAEGGTKRMERLFQGVRSIFDFSSETIGGTYKGRGLYNISIPVGTSFKIYVTGNDDGANRYYFNFLSGNTRIVSSVSAGNGNRVVSLTNTYGSEITGLEMVVQAVNYAATYDILVINDGDKDVGLELDLLKESVSWLPDFLVVPDYYDTMLSTKVPAIRNAMLDADKNGSTFVFITDVHWPDNSKQSPALINYLLQRLPITDVFFGGDVINGGVVETQIGYFEDFGKKMHQVASRFFAVRGNHENNLNDGGTGFDGDYFYTLLLKYADYLVVPGDYDTYYFDNETTKTRFIVLNTGQGGDHYTSEQSSWLSSVLAAMPTGYHAIILIHMAYSTAADLTSGTMTPTMAAAASVADSFNAENNGKKVEAFISGHLHNDANKVTSGGIPIILTDCDARQTSSGNPQTDGTTNEQAFDVITIDYSGKITCTRIGRGNDREINYNPN